MSFPRVWRLGRGKPRGLDCTGRTPGVDNPCPGPRPHTVYKAWVGRKVEEEQEQVEPRREHRRQRCVSLDQMETSTIAHFRGRQGGTMTCQPSHDILPCLPLKDKIHKLHEPLLSFVTETRSSATRNHRDDRGRGHNGSPSLPPEHL